ncbi:MAG: HpcH/HpaI aldolase family protein [Anaerolineae bacterium]
MGGIGINKIERNPVKDKLHSGQPSVGSWLALCSTVVAETIAGVGFDWLVVDAQHSPVDHDTMVNCFRAIQLGGAVPMARVPWNDTLWIQRTLDAGALGLVVPMVNTEEDATFVVSNFKYNPVGIRSYGSSRVARYVQGDYRVWAQENLAVIVMIETVEAVENAEAILSVPGVDGCFIGPMDLALSMGIDPVNVGPGTEHEAMMQRVLAAGKKVGTAVGKHCFSAEEVNQRIAEGFQFLALASDARFMAKEAAEEWARVKLDSGAGTAPAGKGSLYG